MPELELLVLLISIIGLFVWNRSESRADTRQMDSKLEAYIYGIREDVKAIHDEMKDFHTRLALQDQEFKMRMWEIEKGRK